MASDPVPWMVAGNVQHSVNVARLLAYASFGGSEGIVGPRDLEVRELAVPGPQVRVYPGACAILNRFPGAKYEAYAGRFPTETLVDIAPTGSGGGRSDLIVARVEDPFENGSPFANDGSGVFLRPAVISNVGTSIKNFKALGYAYPAIPLARVDIPPSTGTITQAMIADLRRMTAAVRREEWSRVFSGLGASSLTSTNWADWPPGASMQVDVPDWATHVEMSATLSGVAYGFNPASGQRDALGALQMKFGAVAGGYSAVTYDLSWNQAYGDRTTLMVGGAPGQIPVSVRGTTQNVVVQGFKNPGVNSYLQVDAGSAVSMDVVFYQSPESNIDYVALP